MNITRKKLEHDIEQLLDATTDATEHKLVEARKRLSSAIGKAGEACGHGAESAGRFVKNHAGETAMVAMLAGVAAGYLLFRSGNSHNGSH